MTFLALLLIALVFVILLFLWAFCEAAARGDQDMGLKDRRRRR